MNTVLLRLLLIKDTDSKDEVFGRVIYDEYSEDNPIPPNTTDTAVREYMAEFCPGCYTRNNLLDAGPLSNDFEGRVVTVAEQAGMNEFHVVVKILKWPVDQQEILEYYNKKLPEWEASYEVAQGNPDPRVLDEPSVEHMKKEIFWNVFKQTFALVSLAVVVSLVVGSLFDGKNKA